MNTWELTERFIYTVPLKASHRRIAQQLSQNKLTATQARNFYHNVLAVCAVKDYLEMLGYETNWENSDFLNPAMATFANVADLELKNYGKLECRAVLSEKDLQVPADSWQNRIGYIFVAMDESQQEQHILGYLPSVVEAEGVISLDRLYSLDEFPQYLSQKAQSQSVVENISETIRATAYKLGEWLDELAERGYRNAEELLMGQNQNLSYAVRASSETADSESVDRAKLVNIETSVGEQQVILLLALTLESETEISVLIRLHPVGSEAYLPANTKLELLSDSDEVLDVNATDSDNYLIQLDEFVFEPEEKFKVRITLDNTTWIDEFTARF